MTKNEYIYLKLNNKNALFVPTSSGQQGTKSHTCTLFFKLHHIYTTGGNKLDQPFTKLHLEKISIKKKKD